MVNHTADNAGGGTPGDATHVLRALIESDVERACFGFIYPDVAEQAHRVGPGSVIDVQLGGKHAELHGAPGELSAYVKTVTDGRFVHTSPMLAGLQADYGRMARLQIRPDRGIDVLVGSARRMDQGGLNRDLRASATSVGRNLRERFVVVLPASSPRISW